MLEAVAPIVGDTPADDGLDVCCGTGAATRFLAKFCQKNVIGMDFSENMLGVARECTPALREPAIRYVRGNVLDMEFDEGFDVAVCFGALGHILPRDQARFVVRVARALRMGGRFCFPTSHLPSRFSRGYWLSRGFNAAMRLRNALIRPPFVMYYLTFLVPEATELLERAGFRVRLHTHVFPAPFDELCFIVATKHARRA